MTRKLFEEIAYEINLNDKIRVIVFYGSQSSDLASKFVTYLERLTDGIPLSSIATKLGFANVRHNRFQVKEKFIDNIIASSEIEEVDKHRSNGDPRYLLILSTEKRPNYGNNSFGFYDIDVSKFS